MNEKILIVRNDTEDAKALSFLLSGTGYRIVTHTNAKNAVEAARHEHYDLVITDRMVPENRDGLRFVSDLKEAQPRLPVFLLSEDHQLEDVIDCIRSGVTEIIEEEGSLKGIFEATNQFFNHRTTPEEDVTWEDMVEVEQALSTLFKMNDPAKAAAEEAETKRLQKALEEALSRISSLETTNENLDQAKVKAEKLLSEFKKRSDELSGESTETLERITDLEEREKKLKERETRIAKQKAEAEIMLSDLEERQFEIEEKGLAPAADNGVSEIQKKLDSAQLEWNGTRLDLEAQITDLNRELAKAKVASTNLEEHEEILRATNESLQKAKETIAEKDFILDQRSKEIEKLKDEIELRVSNLDMEGLAEEKRLLEIERFKLQEKADKLDEGQKTFDDEFSKRQREIEVNKKDAEVSLRELQNKVKEEQLKLQVDQASFKEEFRQFEQAKQNFQEDIEDLQNKQNELKQFEDQLKRMQSTLDQEEKTLPKHVPNEWKTAEESSDSTPSRDSQFHNETPVESKENLSEEGSTNDDKREPKTWKKPPRKRKGNRGPLRIGRLSYEE